MINASERAKLSGGRDGEFYLAEPKRTISERFLRWYPRVTPVSPLNYTLHEALGPAERRDVKLAARARASF